jgi:hypothetical protein
MNNNLRYCSDPKVNRSNPLIVVEDSEDVTEEEIQVKKVKRRLCTPTPSVDIKSKREFPTKADTRLRMKSVPNSFKKSQKGCQKDSQRD